jgi:putative peptidoglycan lipid II flippase
VAEPRLQRRIFASAATIGILSFAAKLAGAAKLVVVARFFGASDELDAFLIAFLLPAFVADVVAGSFTPSLVPLLVRVREAEGIEAARRLTGKALSLAIGFMLIAAVGLALTARWTLPLAGSSFSQAKLQRTTVLFFELLLWLPASAGIATWRAVLNANQDFALVALAPIATPVLSVILLYTIPAWGVAALCAGTVAGVALECALLGVAVIRLGYPVIPRFTDWRDSGIGELGRQYLPLAASAVLSSACLLVDQSVAGRLGTGQVAAFAYGNKLAVVLVQVVAVSIGTAVLPFLSSLAAIRDWPRLRRTALKYSAAVIAAAVPLTVVLIAASGFLVRLFFERGAFQDDTARLVTEIQRFSLLQLPFAMLLAIATRLASAISANSLLARVGVVILSLNIVLDLALSRWMGVAGIALSTAILQAVSLLTLVALLRRREPRLFLAEAA